MKFFLVFDDKYLEESREYSVYINFNPPTAVSTWQRRIWGNNAYQYNLNFNRSIIQKVIEFIPLYLQKIALAKLSTSQFQENQSDLELFKKIKKDLQAIFETRSDALTELGKISFAEPSWQQESTTLADIIHELKNPLAVITNAVYFIDKVLPKAAEPEKIAKHLGFIQRELDKINDQLNNLSKMKAIFGEEMSLLAAIKNTLRSLNKNYGAEIKNATGQDLISISISEGAQKLLTGGKAYFFDIEAIFGNLLTNSLFAVKALRGKGKIAIEIDEVDGKIQIKFKDNGSGIESCKLTKIFEPLFTTKGTAGSGVGLNIVKATVEKYGGQITCRSEAKAGAEFTILLPPDLSPIQPEQTVRLAPAPYNSTYFKILPPRNPIQTFREKILPLYLEKIGILKAAREKISESDPQTSAANLSLIENTCAALLEIINEILSTSFEGEASRGAICTLSHDLKSPLLSLKEYANLILEGENDLLAYFDLTLFSLEQKIGKFGEILESQEMLDLDKHILDFKELIPPEQIKITIEYPGNPLPVVLVYANKFGSLINNILTNCRQAGATSIEIKVVPNYFSNELVLIFKDNGCGISQENLEKLNRGEQFTTKETGSGAGSLINRVIIKKHFGSITYRSDEGKETRVFISLPVFETSLKPEK